MPDPKQSFAVDDRREWLRIDDTLLLEYRVVGEPYVPTSGPDAAAAEETITTFISKPTNDLLAFAQLHEGEALLVPWLKKIDWVLEAVLHRLVRMSKETIQLPRLTEVNISGGGVSFSLPRRLQAGDQLDLHIILPPFSAIQARVDVMHATPVDGKGGAWWTGTCYTQISQDDHECLIRHILHVQAERLRARHFTQPPIT
jgi:hypothetical protein